MHVNLVNKKLLFKLILSNYLKKKSIEILKNNFKAKKINIQIEPNKKNLYIQANILIENIFYNILLNVIRHNENFIKEIFIKISRIENEDKKFIKIEFIDNG
ncbi:MAG: hypothetical protein KGD57_08180 [Candidatus Lokiarchaeota archaeon]|nr:hypothetical protein [Candidatus Lokiarchaeota archaeon]